MSTSGDAMHWRGPSRQQLGLAGSMRTYYVISLARAASPEAAITRMPFVHKKMKSRNIPKLISVHCQSQASLLCPATTAQGRPLPAVACLQLRMLIRPTAGPPLHWGGCTHS